MTITAASTLHRAWLTIWYAPRQTIRSVVCINPQYGIHWLCTLWFFFRLRGSFGGLWIGAYDISVLLNVFWAMIFGRVLLYFYAGCTVGVSKALGGQANPYAVLGAVGWSLAPGVLIGLIEYGLYTLLPNVQLPGLLPALAIVTLIWQAVILVLGLMEIHGFSAPRAVSAVALATMLLALLVGGFWWFSAHPGGWELDLGLG